MNAKCIKILVISFLVMIFLSACGTSNSSEALSNENSPENVGSDTEHSVTFPEHEVTIIVPNAAGGSNDLVARSIARSLQERLGVPVVVRNVESAGGSIARAQVFTEKPDGYTILTSPMPSMAIGELVNGDDFKTLEFEPIFNLYGYNSSVVAVPSDSSLLSFEDLLELSKEKNLVAAGTGAATNSTLASILLKDIGLEHQYVPFQGDSGASTQVAGGHVDFGLISESGAEALTKDGSMRIIAYLGEEKSQIYPEVTTLVELGYEDTYYEIIYGFFAPPDTPRNIIEVLESAFADTVINDKSFQEMANNSGLILKPMHVDEFREAIETSYRRVEQFRENFEIDN